MPNGAETETIRALVARIRRATSKLTGAITLMEVCGTHTHAIAAAGLRALLPPQIRLVSGPGCPVCVTPVGYLDHAEALARLPGTRVFTFGDLYRVPSSTGSLEKAAAGGGSVQIVYSAQDAVKFAREHRDVRTIFLAILCAGCVSAYLLDLSPARLIPDAPGRLSLIGEFFSAALSPALTYESPPPSGTDPLLLKVAEAALVTVRFACL